MLRLMCVFASAVLLVTSTASADISAVRDVSYGAHPEQAYDVYFDPEGQNAALIIMLHGGAWAFGRKEARNVWFHKSRYFVPRGHVLVSVETRLLPDGADPREQAMDLAQAVRHIRQRASRWGADSDRVVLMGHSAGAHVSALVAADPALRRTAGPLAGVVVLDTGTLDLQALMMDDPANLFLRAFGQDPAYWQAASPRAQIGGGAPPYYVVCRTTTADVCNRARSFAATAAKAGVQVTVMPSRKSHRDINADLGKDPRYSRDIARWIDAVLR